MIAAVGWFEIVVGASVVSLWTMLLVTRQVPQIAAGQRDIWFHLTAELLTALLLVVGGVLLLSDGDDTAGAVSAVALGALLYTTINSPGYYADRGETAMVGIFATLALATLTAVLVLLATV